MADIGEILESVKRTLDATVSSLASHKTYIEALESRVKALERAVGCTCRTNPVRGGTMTDSRCIEHGGGP